MGAVLDGAHREEEQNPKESSAMPESASRGRKKPAYTPQQRSDAPALSKPWYAPVCVALLIVGLIWVVVTYISEWAFPIPGIRAWNLGIGFAIMMVGFVMLMRWR